MSEVVYFLQSGNRRYVKIGYTTNLQMRMQTIAADLKFRWGGTKASAYIDGMQCVGYIPGGKALEKTLHEKFAQYRHGHYRSEWYKLSSEIAEYILTETVPFIGLNKHGQPIGYSKNAPMVLGSSSRRSVTIPQGVYDAIVYIASQNGSDFNTVLDSVLLAYVDIANQEAA